MSATTNGKPAKPPSYLKILRKQIVIYEPSAGRRCSRMSAFFKARATKERVPLINARMNGRCLHASGSYNIFCTKIKLKFFVLIKPSRQSSLVIGNNCFN
jgi:hypothetical protein